MKTINMGIISGIKSVVTKAVQKVTGSKTSLGNVYLTPSEAGQARPTATGGGLVVTGGATTQRTTTGETVVTSGGGGFSAVTSSGGGGGGSSAGGTTITTKPTLSGVTQPSTTYDVSRDIPKTQSYSGVTSPSRTTQTRSSLLEDLRGIGSTMATPFKPAFEKTKRFFEEKVTPKISKAEEKIRSIVNPQSPQEEKYVKESAQFYNFVDVYTKGVETTNTKVESFNKKWGDTEIKTQSQLNQYTNEKSSLEKEISLRDKQFNIIQQRTSYLEGKERALRIAKESSPITFIAGVITGVVTFPLVTAKLGIGLATSPISTLKEQYEGVKSLPKTIATRPASTLGELAGNVIGGIITGRVIGEISKGRTFTLEESQAIRKAINSKLGLGEKVRVQSVGFAEGVRIRNNLQSAKLFSEDPNVQTLIQRGSIGKAVRETSQGIQTERWVLKGDVNGKEYTLTFKQTESGIIQSVKVAVTENKITTIYRPAQPSEKVKGLPKEQYRQTGSFAKQGKIVSQKTEEVGGQTLRAVKSEAMVYQVGKGRVKPVTFEELMAKNQPAYLKLLKQPKPVAQAKGTSLEVISPKEDINLIYENEAAKVLKKIGERQKKFGIQIAEIERYNPIDFDVTKMGRKTPLSKTFNNLQEFAQKEFKQPQFKQITKQITKPVQLPTPAYSIEELGFNPAKVKQLTKTPVRTKPLLSETSSDLNKLWKKEGVNIKEVEKNLLEGRTKAVTIAKTRGKGRATHKNIPIVTEIPAQNVAQLERQIERTIQKLRQPLVNIPKFPEYNFPIPKIPDIKIPPVLPFGQQGMGSQSKKRLRIRTKPFVPKYAANLAAAVYQQKPIKVSPSQFEKLVKKAKITALPVLEVDFSKV